MNQKTLRFAVIDRSGRLAYAHPSQDAADRPKKEELPPITQFLNRVLALRIDLQNTLFATFEGLLEARIEALEDDAHAAPSEQSNDSIGAEPPDLASGLRRRQ